MISALGSFIGLIAINSVQPVAQTQTTIQTPTGSSTVFTKTCTSIPPVNGNSLCLNSNNVQNPSTTTTPAALAPVCSNSGTICTSVPVTTIPVANTTTTVLPVVSPTVQIIPIISITDNYGKITSPVISGVNFGLSALSSFIAIQGSNTPIDHGTISMQLVLKSTPGDNLTLNGIMWVSINGIQLHPQGIPVAASAIADSAGSIPINLQLPSGLAKSYVMNINDRSTSLTMSTNSLNFTISNVSIKNGKGQSYSDTKQTPLYSVQLITDPNKVIQAVGSTGQYVQIYPNDDTVTATSVGDTTTSTIQVQNPRCGPGCPITYSTQTIQSTSIGPTINTLSVYLENLDGTESLVSSSIRDSVGKIVSGAYVGNACQAGATGIFCQVTQYAPFNPISNISRDINIRIHVDGSMPTFDQKLHTPVLQKSYVVNCHLSGCSIG